jgi:hypothetical protein
MSSGSMRSDSMYEERRRARRQSSRSSMDRSGRTRDVDRAYMGGGMILQGAPGAPAPIPEPTPPGETPRNMVPMR